MAGLVAAGILSQVSSLGTGGVLAGIRFPLAISEEAEAVLTFADIHFSSEPTEADKQRILNSRPDFVLEMKEHGSLFPKSWL